MPGPSCTRDGARIGFSAYREYLMTHRARLAGHRMRRMHPRAHNWRRELSIGTSILMIALGSIVRLAVDVNAQGFDIHAVGLILMIVGVVWLLISLLLMSVWADRRRDVVGFRREPDVIVRDRDVR